MLLAHAVTLTEARSASRPSPTMPEPSRPPRPTNAHCWSWTGSTGTTSLPSTRRGSPTPRLLLAGATSAIERLAGYDVDALRIELLLAALDDARALDEP